MSRALGRYELLRPLARGGMGEVYLARRRAAGVEKWLVVKRMRPERAGDTRFLDLFMREAKLTMSLAHQNIVPVFDFGRIDDQVFLAMERVEGKDLGSSLSRSGKPLPPLLAAWVAAECLQALDYAHHRKGPDGASLGIVHRDVTPRNVLLSWSGEVKLTDFGIAALAADSPSSRTAGTPAYMAPEQARGEPTDARADVYAVGLVLREALVGERVRKGNDRDTVLEIAKRGELDPWGDGVDAALRAICDRATAVDKADRYTDARSMLEELDAFIVGERAAHKGDAPARQLATWLDEVWKDAREDEAVEDAKIEAGVLVSFMDDGALDVIGTGTQRSMLATAADATPLPRPLPKPPESDVAKAAAKADARVEPAAEAKVTGTAPPRRRFPLVAVLLGLIAVVAVAVFAWPRSENAPIAMPPNDAMAIDATGIDATVVVDVDAAMPVDATTPAVDAAEQIAEVAIDAGVTQRPRPRPIPTITADAAVAPVVAAKTRKVTINSKPWSNWTVDGGAQHSGLETIELAPGRHTIHFTGNPYFKADKKVTIDVPDSDGFTHVETLEAAP